jgi:DNA-dependent RNA polymerase
MQYYARFDGNSIELEKVKTILKEQIKSLSLSKTLKIIEKPTLKNCLLQQNYKLRESFFYRHLQNDLQNCHEQNYLYNSMISYDSTSSGTQMMGMLIRSKSVASLGLLVKDKDQKDVYESFLDYNRDICNNITTWFESYFNEIPKLKPFLEQTRIKINQLQESHYVELYQQKRWPAVNNKKFIENFNEEFVNLCNDILSENPYINTLVEELEKEILEHMYSKIFWLESFSKHIFKHPKKIYNRLLKAFVILIEMFGYIDDFNSPNIQDVYIRQLVKQMLMTSIYGATAYGRYQQLMNSYFKITVAKGLNVSDSVFMQVSNFFTYLNPILIYWIETQHPRLLLLTKAISKIKYLKDFPTVTLQNDTSMFCFEPKESVSYRYTKNKKTFRYKLYNNNINYDKISTALTANIIHFCDASLVHAYFRKLCLNSYYGFTVHDRFFIHVAQSDKLYPILKELYLNLYNADLFKRNFKSTRLYSARVNLNSIDYLNAKDLLNPKFVKM